MFRIYKKLIGIIYFKKIKKRYKLNHYVFPCCLYKNNMKLIMSDSIFFGND